SISATISYHLGLTLYSLFSPLSLLLSFFFFHDPPPPEIYTLSLHDALPISTRSAVREEVLAVVRAAPGGDGDLSEAEGLERSPRSEEHTSELQSRGHLVCRLLLEKKKNKKKYH